MAAHHRAVFHHPLHLKQVDASKVLPGASVVNSGNYKNLLGDTAASKQAYFNSKYAETYKGSATMYTINGYSYILNSHENKTINAHQDASFALKKKANMTVDLPEHSYVMLYDNTDSLKLELYNYRYDAASSLIKRNAGICSSTSISRARRTAIRQISAPRRS